MRFFALWSPRPDVSLILKFMALQLCFLATIALWLSEHRPLLFEAGYLAWYSVLLCGFDILNLGGAFLYSNPSTLCPAFTRGFVLTLTEAVVPLVAGIAFGHKMHGETMAWLFDLAHGAVKLVLHLREVVVLGTWEKPGVAWDGHNENCAICRGQLEDEVQYLACGNVCHRGCLIGCMVGRQCPQCGARKCLRKTQERIELAEQVRQWTDAALIQRIKAMSAQMDTIMEVLKMLPDGLGRLSK
jgi:hypothetical protein